MERIAVVRCTSESMTTDDDKCFTGSHDDRLCKVHAIAIIDDPGRQQAEPLACMSVGLLRRDPPTSLDAIKKR